jgi:hypothetical protein
MKKYFMLIVFFLPIYAFAASPLSQYKQFGSIAALAETCLRSEQIPQKINAALKNSGLGQEMINTLVEAYNDGYKTALLNNKLWVAEGMVWTNSPFSCNNNEDVKSIKQFESQILAAL